MFGERNKLWLNNRATQSGKTYRVETSTYIEFGYSPLSSEFESVKEENYPEKLGVTPEHTLFHLEISLNSNSSGREEDSSIPPPPNPPVIPLPPHQR